MKQFKRGDVVRVTNDPFDITDRFIGKEGIISEIAGSELFPITVIFKECGGRSIYDTYNLELVEDSISTDRIYPTYDLSLKGYNLSPLSPAYKKENDLKVGDLIEIKEVGLGIINYFGTNHLDVHILGEYFGPYCASYDQIVKDSRLIKELKEYFKNK